MKIWAVEHFFHHFWVGATANPPKSDDRYAQLSRGEFIINDFLQNPHFTTNPTLKGIYLRKGCPILGGFLVFNMQFRYFFIDYIWWGLGAIKVANQEI